MLVSLLLIVNNQKVYSDFLLNISTQKKIDYEILPIMNTNYEYDSARTAYNEYVGRAKGEYLIFMHPDIRFLDEMALCDIINYAASIKDFGVVGVAGAREVTNNKSEILSSIIHGEDRCCVGEKDITGPESVQTVDECMFIVKKDYFMNHYFSNKKGWHLYAVEYCLSCIINGKQNYVVPARLWHISDGKSLNEKYVEEVEVLVCDYRNSFGIIHTTIKTWKTKGATALLYRKFYWMKQYIKRKIHYGKKR